MRWPPDKSHLNSFKHNAGGPKQDFCFLFKSLIKSSSGVILPISPGCPGLVILKAFLWTSSRGGKVATIMLLLLCYSFLYNYIYPCIYSYIFFSIHIKFLLWRYWWDILLFASVPVASLWGAASGRRRAPLVPKLEAPGASGAIAAVVALRVTFTRWPALLAFPAALPVVAFLLLVSRTTAGARLLGLVHAQLAQRLARRSARGSWGRGRRGRVLGWPLAHLGVAELTGLL